MKKDGFFMDVPHFVLHNPILNTSLTDVAKLLLSTFLLCMLGLKKSQIVDQQASNSTSTGGVTATAAKITGKEMYCCF